MYFYTFLRKNIVGWPEKQHWDPNRKETSENEGG